MIPISALFISIHALIAIALSFIVALERTRTRLWHGESQNDVTAQPNYLERPNAVAALVEQYTQRTIKVKAVEDGILQRKVRAYGNFIEAVPLALLLILALELMQVQSWLLWLLSVNLTIARIAHAWGLIKTYGPSLGRAIGFYLTGVVYLIGAGACIYSGVVSIL